MPLGNLRLVCPLLLLASAGGQESVEGGDPGQRRRGKEQLNESVREQRV